MALATQKRWQLYVCSGVGSCAADAGTIWIDVVKVRLQLTAKSDGANTSTLSVLKNILGNEGPGGLVKVSHTVP
eukprot:SAG31_NODE_28429_length_410_cov_1.102894_1_plen_73_part_10